MKKLYEKNRMTFAIAWIVAYCVLQSLANPLNEKIGIEYSASAAFCILQSIILFAFIWKNGLMEQYGLCGLPVPARSFLYYVPLFILATGNLWNGVAVNYPPSATACRMACMLCVGFLEEMIFRGFLFRAMAKDNIKSAIIISSMTFGIGHLVNLFNGSGMDLVNNLCQVCFAIAVGFLFVTIYHRGGSLLPCIITHSAINTLGTFFNEAGFTAEKHIIHGLAMMLITIAYTLILTKTLPKRYTKNNTPTLLTERLILRKFTENDMEALYQILKDEDVNRFLPWHPLKNIQETRAFYEERYAEKYMQPQAYAYAICLRSDNYPIGYINVDMEEHHDFGYGLRKEFWHKGIVTEAAKAVIEQVKKDGLPYITATHDRNNPRSGGVMQQVGMKYCYSYEEQWQPKDIAVIFRMYQLNLDGNEDRVYQKYWNESKNHFIETMEPCPLERRNPENN